jgi:hypothetical protein
VTDIAGNRLLSRALLLILVTASFFFFEGGPDAHAVRSYKEIWNLGHILYFALLVLLFSRWSLFMRLPLFWCWVLLIGLSLISGFVVELLQYGTARSADLMDVSRDLCGALLMLAFHPAFVDHSRVLLKRILQVITGAFLIYHLLPVSIAITDETIARFQFPVLSDFSTPFELERWKGNGKREVVEGYASKTGKQMKISLPLRRYAGVGMEYMPADWSSYRFVNLDIYSEYEKPLSLSVRVHDDRHQTVKPTYLSNDRFNKRFKLVKGWNTIKIDLSEVKQAPHKRAMDMQKIVNISFFMSSIRNPKTLYLDQIYLSQN